MPLHLRTSEAITISPNEESQELVDCDKELISFRGEHGS